MYESSILCGPRRLVPPGPTPGALDKHFDFLEWSAAGDSLLIGTSDLTSRSWGGSIWVYNDENTKSAEEEGGWHPTAGQCLVGASMDCGVTVGRFLQSSEQFVLGCDSGAVQINEMKKMPSNDFQLQGQASLSEHNDMVLDIDKLGGDGLHFVSCSEDKSIKVWDLEALISEYTYSPAHCKAVTSVRSQPSQNKCFASCSRDGSALLWDTRDDQPASSLMNRSGVGLTALAWVNETCLLIGGVSGIVSLIDVRSTKESSPTLQLERRPIHLMRSIPSSTGLVSICQDNSKVSVVSCQTGVPETTYVDDRHGDFVRGLAWHPKNLSLMSCGWDAKIFYHKVDCGVNGAA